MNTLKKTIIANARTQH